MTISEDIHNIKNTLRKKNGDKVLVAQLIKLLKIERDITRHTKKCFNDINHPLQFSGGDLRIITRLIRTKLNKFQQKLYYQAISDTFKDLPQVTSKEFVEVINKAKADFIVYQQLSECYYLYSTITASVELIEVMRRQQTNVKTTV